MAIRCAYCGALARIKKAEDSNYTYWACRYDDHDQHGVEVEADYDDFPPDYDEIMSESYEMEMSNYD